MRTSSTHYQAVFGSHGQCHGCSFNHLLFTLFFVRGRRYGRVHAKLCQNKGFQAHSLPLSHFSVSISRHCEQWLIWEMQRDAQLNSFVTFVTRDILIPDA